MLHRVSLRDTLRHTLARIEQAQQSYGTTVNTWLTCNESAVKHLSLRFFSSIKNDVCVWVRQVWQMTRVQPHKRFADGTFANATNGVQFLNERWSDTPFGFSATASSRYISISSPFQLWFLIKGKCRGCTINSNFMIIFKLQYNTFRSKKLHFNQVK